jgi:hypothetical protein
MRKYLRAIAKSNMALMGTSRVSHHLGRWQAHRVAAWRIFCTPEATQAAYIESLQIELKNDEKRKAGSFKRIVRKPA